MIIDVMALPIGLVNVTLILLTGYSSYCSIVCSLFVMNFASLDVFVQGNWKFLQEIDDPELKELAGKLLNTILRSRTDSTVTKYLRAYKRWKTWSSPYKLQPLPAKAHQFVLYLQHLADDSKSQVAVEEAANAVSWVHSSAGLTSPMADPFARATL